MKRTLLFLFAISLFGIARAQYYPDASSDDTTHFPYWAFMMQDPNANFRSVQHAFEVYWAGRSDHKGNGWKTFKRWEYIMQDQVGPDGKLPTPGSVMENINQWRRVNSPSSLSGNWIQVGPVTVPNNATGQPNGLGRVNAVCFHPSDPNTIYAGAPSGGLWKSTDGGNTWTALTSSLPTLGVSAILVHPSNPSILWIGTGDRDAGDAPGMGVYKSTDGGNTWTAFNSGMGNATVGMMILHPSDPNTLLAATSTGIYKSTDGGVNWTRKSSNTLNYKDIRFKPGDPTVVYATENGHFYRSSNTGDTWTQVMSGIVTGTRMVIGVSPNQPSWVYLIQTNGPFAGCLKSTDSGQTFTTQSTTPNLMDYNCDGGGTSSQAWYDLCVAVDPADANSLYVGGINVWKSTNGGLTWTITSHWIGNSYGTGCASTVHADIHSLDWSPLDGFLYTGCDGGLYSTATHGSAWTDLSSGLAIAQVYKIGQSATKTNLVMNGFQDNGTACNSGNSFTTVIGGDGMECLVDYTDTNYRYGEYYYGNILRTSGSGYITIAASGVNGITESGAWVTPFLLHATVPGTMFAGYANVWRSTNVKSATPSWTKISSGESVSCNVLEQSPANVNILYAVRGNILKRTDNANDPSPSWITCTSPSGSNITALEAHPSDPNTVYATAGAKIYKSTDKGITWTNISGTLPSSTINTLVYDKTSNEGIYIGNKTGVFYKDATMTDWISFSNGLPNVDVRELEIYYDASYANSRIKAATYGRGQWQSDLYGTAPVLSVVPQNQNVPASPAGFVNFTVTTGSTWTASSNQSWCTVTPSGSGNGTVTANYAENAGISSRVATITITVAGIPPATVTVTQAGAAPTLSVTPSNQDVPSQPAGNTFFIVTTNSIWNVVSNQSWCTIPRPGSGTDTLTVFYEENYSIVPRIADITVTVPGLTPVVVTVTQAGAAPSLSVMPSNQDVPAQPAGSTSFDIVSNTTWTVSCGEPWCSVTPSGTGDGTLYANYSENSGGDSRVAHINVQVNGLAPVLVTVTQSGTIPVLSIAPPTWEVSEDAGRAYFFITSNTVWNANSDQPWCLIDPLAGYGNDTLFVSYDENFEYQQRTANIMITASGLPPSSVSIIQDPSTLSSGNTSTGEIRIYPNPSKGEFYIVATGRKKKKMDISIRNPEGQLILERTFGEESIGRIDLSAASPGTYFLMLRTEEDVTVRKLVLIR